MFKPMPELEGEPQRIQAEQPAPSCVQAPVVLLQGVPAGLEEEQLEEEAALPREVRLSMPVDLPLVRLRVSMPEQEGVVTPAPVILLPPVIEQAALEEAEMTAQPTEPVAPAEAALPVEQVASHEEEMTEAEVLQELEVAGEQQAVDHPTQSDPVNIAAQFAADDNEEARL